MADPLLTTAEKLREIVRRQIDLHHERDGFIEKDDALALATLIRASGELTAEEDARHDAEVATAADDLDGPDATTVEDLLQQAASEPRQ